MRVLHFILWEGALAVMDFVYMYFFLNDILSILYIQCTLMVTIQKK